MKQPINKLPNQSNKKQANKTVFEEKIEKIKQAYSSTPDYIDKTTKELMQKYNL